MEAKGKQDLWTRQKPEVLAVLRERAMIQSVESSNRIEGVTIPPNRRRPGVLGKARPRDRSEEELAGYRRALDWIHSRKGSVTITAGVIRKLHAYAQGGSTLAGGGDAGEWKKRNNEIVKGGAKLDHWGGEKVDHFTGGRGRGLKDLRGRLERRPAARLAGRG
jgi:hypothetical protein